MKKLTYVRPERRRLSSSAMVVGLALKRARTVPTAARTTYIVDSHYVSKCNGFVRTLETYIKKSGNELNNSVEAEEIVCGTGLNGRGGVGGVGVVGENHGSRLASEGLHIGHDTVQDGSDIANKRGDLVCGLEVSGREGLCERSGVSRWCV